MKKFYITLLMALWVFSCPAEITQENDMEKVFCEFKDADTNTLAVFDVDMVLVQPSDPAFQMANMKRYSPVAKRIMQDIPKNKQMVFLSLMTVGSNPILVDACIPKMLTQLKQRGIPAMALTANLTGEFYTIKNMETWRVNTLRQLGIDFSQGAPYLHPIIFQDLPSYRGNYSVYSSGVLFVNGTTCSKGEAFIAFLKKAEFYPKKVIFVDDREENLKSVESALQDLNKSIAFHGIHFEGAKNYPSEVITEQQFEARWKEIAAKAMLSDDP